jgi:adenylyltransferase/sulfurtransferase
LIDVRPKVQFGICSLPNSVHIPIDELEKRIDEVKQVMTEKNVQDENG